MVRREGNRVWIEGAKETFLGHFEDYNAGKGTPWAERCETYMYLARMRIAGWDIDYADLNAIAGLATSFGYAPRPKDRWMAHYFPVEGRDDRIAHATGFRNRWRFIDDVEVFWSALKAAIDAGRVVQAPKEENVLFYGYVDAQKPEDRKVLPVAIVFVPEEEWTWEQFTGWFRKGQWFGCFEERVAPWPARQAALDVMGTLVDVAEGKDSRKEKNEGVVWGIDGVEAYAKDLADLTKSGAKEDEGGYFQGGWRGCHNVYPQMSGRPAAAAYLRNVAEHFEPEVAAHLLVASEAYESATASWAVYERTLGRSQDTCPHDDAWQSSEYRQKGAEAVRQAARHERNAVTALKSALAAATADDLHPASGQIDTPVPVDDETQTGNSFGRALAAVLRHRGIETDYATVMGDLGQAFVTQGVVYADDLSGGYADVGWWPLDLFQMFARLPFLADVSGCRITSQRADFSDVSPDPDAYYRKHFKGTVESEINAGRPVISIWHGGSVVTGYDTGRPPIKGWCLLAGEAVDMRCDDYPNTLCTLEDRFAPIDRREADLLALRHAVALGRGAVPTKGAWVTGPEAWRGWQDQVVKRGAETPHYWQANQRKQLTAWRRCAVDYLDAMGERHGKEAATHLGRAAALYGKQIDTFNAMNVTKDAFATSTGRDALVEAIRTAAALDAQAVDALDRAAEAIAKEPRFHSLTRTKRL